MIPKPGDVLDWCAADRKIRWEVKTPLVKISTGTASYDSGFKYAAQGQYLASGYTAIYIGTIVFEELDITLDNSNWRFVEDPFVLYVKEVLQNAETEKG